MAQSLNQTKLQTKFSISTGVLIVSMLLGSLVAFFLMQRVSHLTTSVAEERVPLLSGIRDLRAEVDLSTSSLKSYLLFGIDPSLAGRYKDEREKNWAHVEEEASHLESMNAKYDLGADKAKIEAIVNETKSLGTSEAKVQTMAIGQGSDAAGQAFDLLRVDVAAHEAKLNALLNDIIRSQTVETAKATHDMASSAQTVNIVLGVATLLGALIGWIFSSRLARRIVKSIEQVAERAESIADGDLTGESLLIESNDEITALATSINRMQQNLREMIRTMTDISGTIHTEAEALANSSADSFQRTEEQSQQTHQAAATVQEMSISIAEVNRHAQTAAVAAKDASNTAREGGAIVEQMLTSMQGISSSVRNTASTVQRLGKESDQIIHIVNVIEEIAQKTNLLALNAAIEAARAGEQGRGFAVVAGEVRRLAESTRNATSEIAQMIGTIRTHTLEAVGAMETGTQTVEEGMVTTTRAGESLNRIIGMAGQVDQMIAQIATASSQQTTAAQQSSENLDVISKLGADGAAAIPATQRMIEAVETGARRLREYISQFRVEESTYSSNQRPGLTPSVPQLHRSMVHNFGD
jgi:methyl-accepting chemotaxis protein